jgi:branched-chain amino acid transport system substrate-binding protein
MKTRALAVVSGSILVAIVMVISFMNAGPVLAAEPFKIGYIGGLTGAASLTGLAQFDAFKMAVEEINNAGGLLGHPINFYVRDDKNVPAEATKAARDLVYNTKVDWLFGSTLSGVALAVSEVAKETKTPYVCEGAMSTAITEERGHRYVIRPMGNSDTTLGIMGSVMGKRPYKTYTIMAADYSWGHSSFKAFKDYLLKVNPDAKILKEAFIPPMIPDYSPYISMIMGLKPDYAAMILPTGEAETCLRQITAYGLNKACHVGGFYVSQAGFEALGKDCPEGVDFFSQFFFNFPGKMAEEFRKNVKEKTGRNAGGETFLGYWPIKFLKAAVEKARTTEKEAVIDAFGTVCLKLPVGDVCMRPFDNQGDFSNMVGTSMFSSEYKFALMKGIVYIPGGEFLKTKEQIMELRKGK